MSGLYPARAHAAKVAREIAKKIPDEGSGKQHAILVQSAPVMFRHDTDRELPYHQEANFFYLTGCPVATSSLLVTFEISAGEPVNVKHRLYIPGLDKDLAMWSVAPPSLEEARSSFDSDEIAYCEELPKALSGFVVHILPNTTEFPPFSEEIGSLLKGLDSTDKYLYEALHIARITKDEYEIDLIREANRISSSAHEVLMRELGRYASGRSKASGGAKKRNEKEDVGQWEVESERDAEALFVATCRRAGAEQAYLPIVASGTNASVLHYVCNDRLFPSTSTVRKPGDRSFIPKAPHRGCCGSIPDHDHNAATTSFHDSAFEPQVLLIDAGCEWRDYASDITRTIPVGNGGKFTPRAGEIYELVLKMQKECEAMVRPGIHWDLLHLHAHKVLIEGFISFGIFTGSPEEMLQSGLTHAFFPHGLGHSLGLDVHDSRQYLKADITDTPDEVRAVPAKLHSLLRIRKKLEVGMVLTIEPGCYFPPLLMEDNGVWTSNLVNQDKLREYISVGGVRIEDVVVVREDGVENLTTVGRERAWIEKVCSGQ